mmetsp:Transcript_1901/g.4350  ORF Transcript_1901/g.4350 Transcript_1901/m.4350 type:complete len:212 (+) Transcript_1901:88-723(+)
MRASQAQAARHQTSLCQWSAWRHFARACSALQPPTACSPSRTACPHGIARWPPQPPHCWHLPPVAGASPRPPPSPRAAPPGFGRGGPRQTHPRTQCARSTCPPGAPNPAAGRAACCSRRCPTESRNARHAACQRPWTHRRATSRALHVRKTRAGTRGRCGPGIRWTAAPATTQGRRGRRLCGNRYQCRRSPCHTGGRRVRDPGRDRALVIG